MLTTCNHSPPSRGAKKSTGSDYLQIPIPAKISQNKFLRAAERKHKKMLDAFSNTKDNLSTVFTNQKTEVEKAVAPIRDFASSEKEFTDDFLDEDDLGSGEFDF